MFWGSGEQNFFMLCRLATPHPVLVPTGKGKCLQICSGVFFVIFVVVCSDVVLPHQCLRFVFFLRKKFKVMCFVSGRVAAVFFGFAFRAFAGCA